MPAAGVCEYVDHRRVKHQNDELQNIQSFCWLYTSFAGYLNVTGLPNKLLHISKTTYRIHDESCCVKQQPAIFGGFYLLPQACISSRQSQECYSFHPHPHSGNPTSHTRCIEQCAPTSKHIPPWPSQRRSDLRQRRRPAYYTRQSCFGNVDGQGYEGRHRTLRI